MTRFQLPDDARNRVISAVQRSAVHIPGAVNGTASGGGMLRLYELREPDAGLDSLSTLTEPVWIGAARSESEQDACGIRSFEQAVRLAYNAPRDHISSAQSADPERGHYGGAVLIETELPHGARETAMHVIASVSGFGESLDEQLAIMAVVALGDCDARRVSDILSISGNRLVIAPLA